MDKEIAELIAKEEKRQKETIQLIAAENIAQKDVLSPLSSILVSKTAEGPIRDRHHSGCAVVDEVEKLAQDRAISLFGAKRAWLQPLSCNMANLIVLTSILKNGEKKPQDFRIMSMGLDQGGHFSHGSANHISRMLCPNTKNYCVDKETGFLDYQKIKEMAEDYRPDILICGASTYPREINFAKMKEAADTCGAVLVADIAHTSGLVSAGVHVSPVPYCHFVTFSTYKAGGPKGGAILAGDPASEKSCQKITEAVFPVVQSTPDFGSIAAKAAFFKECMGQEYKETQRRIISNAKVLAEALAQKGFQIATGGTDNHIVLIDIKKSFGLTGKEADSRLEACGINANKTLLPYDSEGLDVGSGIRLGTNTVSRLGMGSEDMERIAGFIEEIIKSDMSDSFTREMKNRIKEFMSKFSFDKFI